MACGGHRRHEVTTTGAVTADAALVPRAGGAQARGQRGEEEFQRQFLRRMIHTQCRHSPDDELDHQPTAVEKHTQPQG